ncbi:alpha/beta hydrolase [Ponticaulis sp.]|uniref:alpha/beta fold hydrolase n=1 Tax=Ponticaulis sp. TaxID=2020902 RepID=UPI000B7069F1|nr:alpha/beta hydrolase [Ponticaulis sp.]MAI91809.1 epoxide hydrolase [Ponticaulis sp.]OUX96680.1 MAG: epoxide hydrolase [Hyphomonadaceae bacterium TMED5]|tara:strand:- start:4721 stop:5695 length:975 start_codon:yes stop_codon:yes gene_type:complete
MAQEFLFIKVNDFTYRVAVEGEGPLVLMVHGFPESWYSWRHQMPALAEAGFKAAAVDVLGYGGTDKPPEIERYSMQNLASDMAEIAKALSDTGKAIVVGHDWGAPIAWNSALLHPDVFYAVGALSVPYSPPGERMFLDVMDQVFTKRGLFFYQIYFQNEGVAEAELEANPRDTIRRFYYAVSGDAPEGTWPKDKPNTMGMLDMLPDPNPFPAWLTEADLDYYEAEFRNSGFRGPLNRYRNHPRDHEYLRSLDDLKIYQPALFIGGEKDLVLKMLPGVDVVERMRGYVPNLQVGEILEGVGHWTQQERPEEVNAILIPWLKKQIA